MYMYIFKVGLYLNLFREICFNIIFGLLNENKKRGFLRIKKDQIDPTPLIFHTPFTCRHTGVNFCVCCFCFFSLHNKEAGKSTNHREDLIRYMKF